MRISKLCLPAAAMVGALALAGCGGGSDSMDDTTMDDTSTDDTSTTQDPETLAGTGLTQAGEIRLEKDDEYETPNNGVITCTTDECVITVANQRGTPRVTVTSGTVTFDPYEELIVANTGDRTGGVTGGTDWLSNRNLIRAIKQSDSGAIFVEIEAPNGAPTRGRDNANPSVILAPVSTAAGGAFNEDTNDITGGSATNHIVVDTLGGRETDLRLVHTRGRTVNGEGAVTDRDTLLTDYLVFGAWERRTAANSGPTSKPQLGYLATGTIHRTNPGTFGIGDARYEGKALGHYNESDGSWSEWEGTVLLEANFAPEERQISGRVNTGITTPDDGTLNLGTITLKTAQIGSSASGDSVIAGGVGSGSGSTGRWHASFYGTAINGSPNGVAGDFRSQRPQITRLVDDVPTTVQTKASIQGAFGAHNVGQLQETDQ